VGGFYYDFEACFETSFIVSHPMLALKGFDFISLSNFSYSHLCD